MSHLINSTKKPVKFLSTKLTHNITLICNKLNNIELSYNVEQCLSLALKCNYKNEKFEKEKVLNIIETTEITLTYNNTIKKDELRSTIAKQILSFIKQI